MGSPRKESNSTYLVEKIINTVIENGHEGKIHEIRNSNISPRTTHDYCAERKGCKCDDAMIDIYEEIYDRDLLIMGTPVYYGK